MKAYLEQELRTVLADLGAPGDFVPEFETPNNPEHGDLATNAALQLARHLRRSPRQIAEDVAQRLREKPVDPRRITEIEVAGPGFLNFRFAETYLAQQVADLLKQGAAYGRTNVGKKAKALVEYVSANPTGPLTVGHGRNAVLGDTIANLLDWTGYEVTREYYFNDAGRQMRVLAQSVRARYEELLADPDMEPYLHLHGAAQDRWEEHLERFTTKDIEKSEGELVEVPENFPEDGYLGEYIFDIARTLIEGNGITLLDQDKLDPFKEAAEKAIFADIERTMKRLGIEMDTYFNEHALYKNKQIWKVLDALRERGYVYDAEGAAWFKTTAFGKDKDTVLVKSSGEPTYRLPDIAYHVNKFERGFERIVDIFGADHIATYPDVVKATELLGYDAAKIDVVIYQFVTLVRGGEPVKMSTRKANFVTLDELMDEVNAALAAKAEGEISTDAGPDVVRFFFLMLSPNTHLNFDLDQATDASDKNPVFYLQYAHARICSIIRKAEEVGFSFGDDANLALLRHESEIALMKEVLHLPEVIQRTAETKEPQILATYLRDVATAFSQFYRDCRIVGEEQALATARMHLARAARITLANGLTVLGISAPEQM